VPEGAAVGVEARATNALALFELDARVAVASAPTRGLALVELVDRVAVASARICPISPALLLAWLLENGLAVERNGDLEPTARCLELGAGPAP
jgi:hypothetical protein